MTAIKFVTNFCPYYRVKTFEMLARRLDVEFIFFSRGDEWFWERRHGVDFGDFRHRTVSGFRLPLGGRVTPGLWPLLWKADVDVFVKDIDGPMQLLMTLVVAKLRRKPFVLWTGMWHHPQTLFHRLTFPLTRLVYRLSDAIATYGTHVTTYLTALGIPEKKIVVATHAVDNLAYSRAVGEEEREATRSDRGIGGQRVVLFVGRLEEGKGVAYLLEAFARIERKGLTLLIVGEGSAKGDLTTFAQKLGVADAVRFVGYVPPAETIPLYAISDVLVVPSITTATFKEPWGLVVNEAMNQGVPVIASEAVGAAAGGLVRHGVSGEVVPERDVEALARSLDAVMGDEGYRRRLSLGARERVAAWSNAEMVEGFVNAVELALGRRSSKESSGPARGS